MVWDEVKTYGPANIRLDEDIFHLHLQKTSWRRVNQDQYIHLSHTSSEDVLVKTNIFVSVIRLQDVFKTFSRRVQDVLPRRFEDIFKTSSRHLQDISLRRLQDAFKPSSKRLQDVLQRYLRDVFKTYYQVKLFLLTRLRWVFNTFLRRTPKTLIYRGICLGYTSEKFMASVQNL